MPKFDAKRLGKTAAGRPAELMINILQGNDALPVALPGAGPRDGLVSVIHAAAGSTDADITSTASITYGGSLDPGTDLNTDKITVTWYKFRG